MNRFIELHDSNQEPILINVSAILSVEKSDDDYCIIKFVVPDSKGCLVMKYVSESYETIKNLLC